MLNEPERLTEIKGITSRRAKEIARQYVEQSAMRELMDFLSEPMVSPSRSRRCCTSGFTTAPSKA